MNNNLSPINDLSSRTFDELSNKSQKEVLEFIEFKRKLEEK